MNYSKIIKVLPFQKEIWTDNYRAEREQNVIDTWRRLAKSIASAEVTPEKKKEVENIMLRYLYDWKLVMGGRINANLGVEGREGTTVMNCFTNSPIGSKLKDVDSIEGIYSLLKEQAKVLKSEGGYGMNFSWIRPAGSYIRGIGGRTPGVLRFMELWDVSSGIITSGSTKVVGERKKNEKKKIRKGAQMGVLNCFSGTTEVLTSEGWMNIVTLIERVSSGDSLFAISKDGKTNMISHPIKRPASPVFRITTIDGDSIDTTIDHELEVYNILTKKTYLKAVGEIDIETEYATVVIEK